MSFLFGFQMKQNYQWGSHARRCVRIASRNLTSAPPSELPRQPVHSPGLSKALHSFPFCHGSPNLLRGVATAKNSSAVTILRRASGRWLVSAGLSSGKLSGKPVWEKFQKARIPRALSLSRTSEACLSWTVMVMMMSVISIRYKKFLPFREEGSRCTRRNTREKARH